MKPEIYVFGIRGFPDVQGGAEKHCEQLYIRLVKLGCRVTVFTRKPYVPLWKNMPEWQGVRLIHLWSPMFKGVEAAFHSFLATIVCLVRRPDVVHIHNMGPALMTGLLKLFGLNVIVTYHSINYHHQKWGRFAKAILKLGERLGCTYADQIIAISEGIRKHVKRKFNRGAHLIPNGIEILERARKMAYIESLGLTPGRYILSVARFVPEKGLHHLISAFSSLQTDWKLVITGDADHETPYSRRLKSQAATDRKVVLTGFIQGNALNEIYSHAGLFVLPSYHEGLPIALLEALSYGLSVLVSDIAPNREVGLDGDRYFPAGNEEALAKKLDQWTKKGPLSGEEQTKQIEMVRQKYNWDNVAEQVLQVYKNVLDARGN